MGSGVSIASECRSTTTDCSQQPAALRMLDALLRAGRDNSTRPRSDSPSPPRRAATRRRGQYRRNLKLETASLATPARSCSLLECTRHAPLTLVLASHHNCPNWTSLNAVHPWYNGPACKHSLHAPRRICTFLSSRVLTPPGLIHQSYWLSIHSPHLQVTLLALSPNIMNTSSEGMRKVSQPCRHVCSKPYKEQTLPTMHPSTSNSIVRIVYTSTTCSNRYYGTGSALPRDQEPRPCCRGMACLWPIVR